jgi:flavodoxin
MMSKVLVAYFSHSGNTREIAEQVHGSIGGDLFEIRSIDPYPRDYDAVVRQAKRELGSGHKPALKTLVDDIASYDTVFVGYPNWWGTFPAPVKTFLSEYDLSGKTVAPFCTHEGSGLGRSAADIAKLCPASTVLEGLAVRGGEVARAQGRVADWLEKIQIDRDDYDSRKNESASNNGGPYGER